MMYAHHNTLILNYEHSARARETKTEKLVETI
jgi:hypothetical protein